MIFLFNIIVVGVDFKEFGRLHQKLDPKLI